jgi:DNA-binding Lrp family transcriptional regulator
MALGLADIAIFRALFPAGEARWWGSRSAIDPRVTPTEIARRTGMSRSAVQVRLKRWSQVGFWTGYEVCPNPRLFGAGLSTLDLPVRSAPESDLLLEQLSLVDGVISARDLREEGGRFVRAFLVDDGAQGLGRRTRQIQRLMVSSEQLRPQPFWIPETLDSLSGLDWRIVACYRAEPEIGLLEAAASLGVTPKTLSWRRDRLVDQNALWWLECTNTAKFPVALFTGKLLDPSWRRSVKAVLEQELEGWIPCSEDGFGPAPLRNLDLIAGLAFVDTPAAVDEVARRIGEIPGVESVRWRVPQSFRSYGGWFDRGIRLQLVDRLRGTYRESLRPRTALSESPGTAEESPLMSPTARSTADLLLARADGPPRTLLVDGVVGPPHEGAGGSRAVPTSSKRGERPSPSKGLHL